MLHTSLLSFNALGLGCGLACCLLQHGLLLRTCSSSRNCFNAAMHVCVWRLHWVWDLWHTCCSLQQLQAAGLLVVGCAKQ